MSGVQRIQPVHGHGAELSALRCGQPYKKAIKECIEKGILADYLMRKGGEVINMLLDEYDYETDIEVQREEAYQIGEQAGLNKGREEGTLQKICSLIQKKLEKGKTISEIADDLEDTEENVAVT